MKHLDAVVDFVERAGAPSESTHDEDGFLSYHAETHALGMGIAAGYAAVAFSRYSLLGIVYGAAVEGRIVQSQGKRRSIWKDIRQEPHYALMGIVFGAVLGAGTRVITGQDAVPLI